VIIHNHGFGGKSGIDSKNHQGLNLKRIGKRDMEKPMVTVAVKGGKIRIEKENDGFVVEGELKIYIVIEHDNEKVIAVKHKDVKMRVLGIGGIVNLLKDKIESEIKFYSGVIAEELEAVNKLLELSKMYEIEIEIDGDLYEYALNNWGFEIIEHSES